MSEKNGFESGPSRFVTDLKEALQGHDHTLLQDLEEEYPHLRRLLTGQPDGPDWQPSGRCILSRVERGLKLLVVIPTLEVEAEYCERSWQALWSCVDNDLENNTVPWRASWQRRQREERKLRALMES